jgi:hypothetical protein
VLALSVGTYHAVMQMPAPHHRPDPCLLLLPELLAAIPADSPVTCPIQGARALRFALDQARHPCKTFDLTIPHYLNLPPGDTLVLVLPRLLHDATVEQETPTWPTWEPKPGVWTLNKLRALVVDLTTEARIQGFQRVLAPYLTGGCYTLDEIVHDLEVAYTLAYKDFGTFQARLLIKEF